MAGYWRFIWVDWFHHKTCFFDTHWSHKINILTKQTDPTNQPKQTTPTSHQVYFHQPKKMSVESIITRELDIRFIDARAIATEAKLNLGIDGYVSNQDQRDAVVNEAMKIFQQRPQSQKATMKVLNSRLNAIKNSSDHSSVCGSSVCDSAEFSVDSTMSGGASRKKGRKPRNSIFSIRRR